MPFDTPAAWNLRRFAQHVKSELCRLCICGDSKNTQETPFRMAMARNLTWKPAEWRGTSFISGGVTGQDNSGTGGADSTYSRFTGEASVMNSTPHGAGAFNNRYAQTSGTKAHSLLSTTYDSAAEITTPSTTLANKLVPACYREQHFGGSVADGQILWNVGLSAGDVSAPITADSAGNFYGGDPFANKTVKQRLTFMKTTASPSVLDMRPFRGSFGSTVQANLNGSPALISYDLDIPASVSSSTILTWVQRNTGNTAMDANSLFVPVSSRIWKPSSTTGLEIMYWCNAGWDTNDFLDTNIIADADLATWVAHMIGNVSGVTVVPGPTCAPTAYQLDIGQNDTGSYVRATFMANYRLIVARLRAINAALGAPAPLFHFIAPYEGVGVAAASVYDDMADAIYRLAREFGAAFTNIRKIAPHPVGLTVGRIGNGTTVGTDYSTSMLIDASAVKIHTGSAGSIMMTALEWASMEGAISGDGRNYIRSNGRIS